MYLLILLPPPLPHINREGNNPDKVHMFQNKVHKPPKASKSLPVVCWEPYHWFFSYRLLFALPRTLLPLWILWISLGIYFSVSIPILASECQLKSSLNHLGIRHKTRSGNVGKSPLAFGPRVKSGNSKNGFAGKSSWEFNFRGLCRPLLTFHL